MSDINAFKNCPGHQDHALYCIPCCHETEIESMQSQLAAAKARETELLVDNDALAFKLNAAKAQLHQANDTLSIVNGCLSAAKAEIEHVKEVLDKSIALNAPLVSENKRLREEIEERGHAFQKVSNENLLEIKRLREALEICHPLAIQEKHAAYRGACGACAALDGGKA